jgi:diguanylate cyclase (GGDEF)-like protein
VGLSPIAREGGVRRPILTPPSPLVVYLTAVYGLGLACITFVFIATSWAPTFDNILIWPCVFLAVAAIAGEVRPIRIPRADGGARTLSTSAPFVLALVAVAGVGAAVLVQAIASLADDVLNRRALKKSLFNTAQYALSVLCAGAIYAWLADAPFFGGPATVEPRDIVPLLVAGIAMMGVNWLLVAGVVSLSIAQPLRSVLLDDLRAFLVTLVVLLSAGGIAALVAADGVGALALLAAPVIAAHLFASAAARHAHDTTHDALTGLGNRGQVDHELGRAFDAAHQSKTEGPGLVLLDLDHFKDFNDTLGHPVGDRILREVAGRLVDAAPSGASVHRIGGDEFVVVVHGGLADSEEVARDVLAALDNPVTVEGLALLVGASVGVAVAPLHGSDGETLMKNADIAMYYSKLERDRISTYSPEFDVNTVERLQLLADLRSAIDARQLSVVYQPQIELKGGRTVGVEALVRWHHPGRGPIGPDDFVPLAENSGLIYPLTAFVLDTALGHLAQWRASGHELRLSVNLSARLLSDLALPDRVSEAAARHGIPLSALVLEVTETGILSDPTRTDAVIRSLRERGVAISIDDYGTGNASLGYLKRLEIDELKIDRSFVSSISTDNHNLIIVRSTIELALALGLRVIAEGVEDEPTTEALRELGSVIGQGYHLGQPVAPEEIGARLDAEQRATAAGPTANGR